jgi:hypothetical protein
MKDNKAVILLVILAVLMAWNIFTTSQIKTDIAGYNQKIDSIQTEIDSVYTQNDLIDNQIDLVDTHISNVNHAEKELIRSIKYISDLSKKYQVIVFTMGDMDDFIINSQDPRFCPMEINRKRTLHDLSKIADMECCEIYEIFEPNV